MHDGEIVTIENCAGKRLFRYSIGADFKSAALRISSILGFSARI